jgi:hypothetical protein
MKYILSFRILFIVGIALGLSACDGEYETIFNEPTDERIQRALEEHEALLKSAPFGWKAMLYTGTGAGYFYYFDFNDEGRVTMISDFNATSAGESMSATWVLKALQRPTLTFDTYSYIHLPADPDGNVNGGGNGDGLVSDFEFIFKRVSGDSIIMQGLKHSTEMVLLKATQAETEEIMNEQIRTVLQGTQAYVAGYKGLQLHLPDETIVPLAIDVTRKMFAAQYISADGRSIETFSTPFTFSIDGILLKEPLIFGGYTIRELYWNNDGGFYAIQLNALTELVNSTEPLIFHPSVPLHQVIGYQFKTVFIPENPEENTLPGQSADFIEAYNDAKVSLKEGAYQLDLRQMSVIFDPVTKQIYFDVITSRPKTDGSGLNWYLAEYAFNYTIDANGMLDLVATQANENGQLISFDMRVFLDHFDQDTFKLEFIAGGFELIGGFYSQNKPEFSYSGYLVP